MWFSLVIDHDSFEFIGLELHETANEAFTNAQDLCRRFIGEPTAEFADEPDPTGFKFALHGGGIGVKRFYQEAKDDNYMVVYGELEGLPCHSL